MKTNELYQEVLKQEKFLNDSVFGKPDSSKQKLAAVLNIDLNRIKNYNQAMTVLIGAKMSDLSPDVTIEKLKEMRDTEARTDEQKNDLENSIQIVEEFKEEFENTTLETITACFEKHLAKRELAALLAISINKEVEKELLQKHPMFQLLQMLSKLK